jgi:hypothetical protein
MDYTFNKSAENAMIQHHFKLAMDEVKNNLMQGKRITELSFPVEIATEVRRLIDEELKDKNFNWLVMHKGTNEYGKVVNFISQTMNGEKHFKLNYFGK